MVVAARVLGDLLDGPGQPTAQERWQTRSPIDQGERERIHLTIERIRSRMTQAMDPLSRRSLTAADEAAIHRRVCPGQHKRGEIHIVVVIAGQTCPGSKTD